FTVQYCESPSSSSRVCDQCTKDNRQNETKHCYPSPRERPPTGETAMTHLLPHQDPREPNSSVLVAAFCVLRRKPWKTLAFRTWDPMKRILQLSLLAASLGALLAPALAHARTYEVMHANVPFKFNIGDRTFRPGHYQLIFVGPGLIALRDSHGHVIAS